MRQRSRSTLTLALVAAIAALALVAILGQGASADAPPPAPASSKPDAPAKADGPAGPGTLLASRGRGAEVELSWQPSPTRGVVYAILDANGKRVGLTSRTRFTVTGFGAKGPRCYRVIALDAKDRASPATPTVCVEARSPGEETEAVTPDAAAPRPRGE